MDDMTLFIIGGLVTFLFVGGALQANLYRALRMPEEPEKPEPKRTSVRKTAPPPSAPLDSVTAWQAKMAITAATKTQPPDKLTDPEQPELH
jgi:hypothetical protein